MRNLSKLAFGRVVIVSLAILLQIGVVLLSVLKLHEAYRLVQMAVTVLSWVLVLYILSNQQNPSYKIAWIILILAFPVAGLTIYLLFGGNKLSEREKRKMNRILDLTSGQLQQDSSVLAALAQENPDAFSHARYLNAASHYPIYPNVSAQYFSSGESCYDAMLQELSKAKHYIFLEFFILDKGEMWDSILAILRQKATEGVDVRVLYDDFGCITRLPMHYVKELAAMNIKAYAFNPYIPVLSGRLNNRDHRKLMIIDGETAFTGGVNLADEYINRKHPFGHWKDCAVLVKGAAAWSMTVMFLSTWDYVHRLEESLSGFRPAFPTQSFSADGYIQPFADSPLDGEDIGATIFRSLIRSARNHVWIMTPYLILDDEMSHELCIAAKTGVDVRIITPGNPDKWYVHAVTRANYEPLTQAGVRIYEYSPGFVHSKVCEADGQYAVVGTVNMDFRSLYLHFEDAVYLHGADAISDIEADFRKTFPECLEITYEACRHVRLAKRVLRSILRMLSPLL